MLSRAEQYRHPKWLEKAEEIKQRDNYTCRVCGDKSHNKDVHHICYFPDTHLWEYDDELLITVCRQHHEMLTYDLPKIAGLIAFKLLTEIDIISLNNVIDILKNNLKKVA
jgi:5-methylcytosine-specific restriction endonuclease McrA